MYTHEELFDLIERALWTAGQTAAALLLADGVNLTDMATIKAGAVAAVAAGLSALKTGIRAHLARRAA